MKYVYILKAGNDHYKVGIAKNVTKRVEGIQTGNAYKVYVVATRLCQYAEKVEQMIHNKLLDMATTGGTEWFKLTPEDVIRVCILLNTQPELDVYDNASLNTQLAEQYEILRSVDKRLKIFVSNKAVAASSAQVQVNNNVAVSDTPTKADKQQRRDMEGEAIYLEAMRIVITSGKASTSMLQRRLEIGYGRAARIMDKLEVNGIIGKANGVHPRKVIKSEN